MVLKELMVAVQAQATTTKPPTKNSSKSSQSQSIAKPAATLKPPASVPDPTLKDPVSHTNKIYYNLVFPIKAWGVLDAMAIQTYALLSS